MRERKGMEDNMVDICILMSNNIFATIKIRFKLRQTKIDKINDELYLLFFSSLSLIVIIY